MKFIILLASIVAASGLNLRGANSSKIFWDYPTILRSLKAGATQRDRDGTFSEAVDEFKTKALTKFPSLKKLETPSLKVMDKVKNMPSFVSDTVTKSMPRFPNISSIPR